MKEMVGGCCVCSDERGWPDNPLVYCDGNGCTVAVHQACYGIIAVPTGPWFCRKCESPETKGKVRCELCPSKSGALKRSDTGGWAHVVCALYIPEVRFGNVTSMEPIVLRLIPGERFNKTCYICQDSNKPHRASAGACMQCNKTGCKQQFHVTCAQSLGLLCEEAGNYLDNVKYCGYCQHHYSKLVSRLKKGGNVKTIPPYKPVSHDSQSSDSSCDKDDDTSPLHSGSGTPTHTGKSKGPGRKSSHSSGAGKNQNTSSKTPTTSTQTMDRVSKEMLKPLVNRKHSKNKKKQSPARRGSSTGDGGSSKASTPAPSPQHSIEPVAGPSGKSSSGGSTPSHSKAQQPMTSPSQTPKPAEPVGVISSVATATSATVATITAATTPNPPASTATAASVVQAPPKPVQAPAPAPYESVITNTELAETKQTKKRKAVSAANTPTPSVDYGAAPPAIAQQQQQQQQQQHQQNEPMSQMMTSMSSNTWDGASNIPSSDIQMEDKIIKKAKTDQPAECSPQTAHFSSVSPAPPPPPPPPAPAHSPASHHSHPSPRHLPSPMPGPSGVNMMSHIRSPSHSHHQSGKGEREVPASLLVSVPLPSASHGLNLTAHSQVSSAPVDMAMPGPSPLIYHQPPKQAAMEPSMPGHSPHSVPGRSNWGGLNVSYEMQQDHSKPGVSGMAGPGKDANMNPMNMTNIPMPPTTIRTKKRQAMATSVVSMATPQPTSTIQSAAAAAMAAQNLASMRRPQQPGPPQPMYHDSIKESPPSSPSSERPLKPKMETRMGPGCAAPHMLGNELNPESGAAARLQEQLSAELAAHAASGAGLDPLVPPPLMNKAAPHLNGAPKNGPSDTSNTNDSDSDEANGEDLNRIVQGPASGRSSTGAQSLDQLLERQWEQGSQFLMEQAQHFDIASLLSCLHQLRTENVRLEEHVGSLLQRRDHLLAVNARLAIPLTTVSAGPPEPSRCPRDSGPQVRAQPTPARTETITSERSHQLLMREVQQKPS